MGHCLGPVAEKLKQKRLIAIIGTLGAMRLSEPNNLILKMMADDANREYDKLYQKGVSGF